MINIKKLLNLRHYCYISDTKVETLYQQIHTLGKSRASVEWGVDLKVFKAGGKFEHETEDSRDDKLKAVLKALRDNGLVGTVDDPKAYIAGIYTMRFGTLRDWGRPPESSPLIYFGGRTEKTMFGLGGSSKHVIENGGQGSTDARSSSPAIIGEILRGMTASTDGWRIRASVEEGDTFETFDAVKWANNNLKIYPEVQLEFCAKVLHTGRAKDMEGGEVRALLGSPLYVAHVDPPDFSYLQ